jgi:hypothetical protein
VWSSVMPKLAAASIWKMVSGVRPVSSWVMAASS